MSTTLTHSGIRVQLPKPGFKKGQLLTVTDYKGKPYSCQFIQKQAHDKAMVSIGGSRFVVDTYQLKA